MKRVALTIMLLAASAVAHADTYHRYDYYDGGVPHVASVKKEGVIQEGPANTFTRNDAKITSVSAMIISDETGEVGKLTWDGGKVKFKGKADRAAKSFFNNYLKKIIEQYMKDQAVNGCHE